MIEPAAADLMVGMECFATAGDRCAGRAKSVPEDFRVEEAVSLSGLSQAPSDDAYPLYRVVKRGVDTMHMAAEMSTALRSRVSYGGLKDSRAVSVQYLTPTSRRSARPGRVDGAQFTAELVGYLPGPLTRSAVAGNRFEIVLRECSDEIGDRIGDAFRAASERRVPNYYGLQRFGSRGRGSHEVGDALVRGDLKGATEVILSGPTGDTERRVARSLDSRPGDWLGAMRAVPLRLRRLYVQAFQSLIFNKALSRAVKAGEDISHYVSGDNWAEVSPDGLRTSYPRSAKETPGVEAVPLVQVPGYAFRDYGSRFDPFVKEALAEAGVTPGQFYIKEMQEASAEGGFRRAHLGFADPTWKAEGGSATLSFALGRGEYATVVLREILKPLDPSAAGLV